MTTACCIVTLTNTDGLAYLHWVIEGLAATQAESPSVGSNQEDCHQKHNWYAILESSTGLNRTRDVQPGAGSCKNMQGTHMVYAGLGSCLGQLARGLHLQQT